MTPRTPDFTPEWAIEQGWSILPCGMNKRPMIRSWKPFQTRRATKEELAAWRRLNPPAWAVVTGKVSGRITLDFDGEAGRLTMEGLNIKPHRRTPSGGFHADFEHPGGRVPTLSSKSKMDLGARWPGLDVRGDGGYAIVAGRTNRGEYKWLRAPAAHPVDALPADLREFLGAAHTSASPRLANATESLTVAGTSRPDSLVSMALQRAGANGRNNSGMWLACQLRDNGISESEAAGIMHNYASLVSPINGKGQRDPYTERETSATLRQAYSRPAREPWGSKALPRVLETPHGGPASTPELLSHHLSDYGNAQRLIALYGADLRYCHALLKWLVWDGRRWAIDDGEYSRDRAQRTILEFAHQAFEQKNENALKFAARCLNSQRISNALREAQPHLAIRPADLDTNPDLLNFSNGTVDLKRSTIRKHRREDFITKLVQHEYRAGAECPTFLSFLMRTTACHAGLIDYLQRAFGYSLTGHTIEKAVFLLHGRGDNGKSTLLSTFLKLLAEYAVLLQIDTLMVRQESSNSQADLADLRGARFAMTSETEEGQRLSEGKLKRITQGMGRIKATRKWENPVEFPETHKLWIDANHLPVVRGIDNAIWNRLHPVPFDVTIPKADQDKELPGKLLAEAEGILEWAVVGARRWYEVGLGKPHDVERAGLAWRAESDQIGRFIQDVCVIGQFAQAKARHLYAAYKSWAEDGGEHPLPEKVFGERMAERHTRKKEATGNVYVGIGLASAT